MIGTFLLRPRPNNNVKQLNSRFCGEREHMHMTVNFSFSVSIRKPFPPVLLLVSSATLYKWNELELSRSSVSNVN